MVEFIEDTANQRCICKSDKLVSDIIIQKELGGYIFFEIKMEQGPTPNELSGKYSSLRKAKEAVAKHLLTKKDTVAARRKKFGDDFEKRKRERNASKPKSEDSK